MTADTATVDAAEPESTFDPRDLRSRGLFAWVLRWAVDHAEWAFRLLRRFWPILRIPLTRWWLVTRFEDVREVLAQDKIFEVPFGRKVKELNGGPNFLLGMADGDEYRRCQKQIMEAFRREDVDRIVAPQSREFAERIIAGCAGRLDAIQDLITRVPTMLCESYYGIPIANQKRVQFAQWTFAMSLYMFADPTNKPAYKRAALAGGERMRGVVDRAIAEAKARQDGRHTVLARLLETQRRGADGMTDEVIRAFLISMVTGFVPTNTMAAGHMLEMLLRWRDFMAPAKAAARAGDDALLQRCLFEAMRFKPLNPGPFRHCAEDYTIGSSAWYARRIRRGDNLLVSTQSAMFDDREVDKPRDFNDGRPLSDYMLFGYGLHRCVGAFIAAEQITQTLKALLRTANLRRADGRDGRLRLLGEFPEHLVVQFDC